ncbi:MAG: hypothetical protein HYY06_18920 [Deltaproteobacteria bacterium]|nr:hypothetical protein [Deltaproteobacteria bacterium]
MRLRPVSMAWLVALAGCPKSDPPDGGHPTDGGGGDGDSDSDGDGDGDLRDAEPDGPYRQDGGRGFNLGSWQIRYESLVYEPNYPGVPSAPVRDCEGAVIKVVVPAFAEQLGVDRRGYLKDGKVVQETGTLETGGPCYAVLDPATSPWGAGSYGRPLEPFRSVFVDPARAGDGRWLYVPQLDRVQMPGDERGLAFRHDGCVRVDDDGATGEVLELWVAFPSYGDQIEDVLGEEPVDVFQDSAYCER